MRVLLTGGAGFIGSHLAEVLLDQGHAVSVIDDLSTGAMDNIAHLKGRPGFDYVIDTITNESLTAELIDQADVVFHLAAAVGVKLIVEAPVRTIETNVHGTEIVLKHASKKGKLVIVFSTSEVYGKSTDVPFREDADLVMGPTHKHRWAYACSKAIDEFLALAYYRERGAAGHRRAPLQHRRAAADRPLRHGDSRPSCARRWRASPSRSTATARRRGRSPTSATWCRRSSRLMDAPGAIGQVFNIGNTEEISILALAERIRTMTRQPIGDRARFPTTRPTKRASRTCRGGCPTSTKIHGAHRLHADGAARRASSSG